MTNFARREPALVRAFADPDSPLFGYRVVGEIHDEVFIESPGGECSEAALRELERLLAAPEAQEMLTNFRRDWVKP